MKRMTLEEIENLPKEFITVREAVSVMGISCKMFYRNIDEMPFTVLKLGRNYKIPKQPFVEYVRSGRTDPKH